MTSLAALPLAGIGTGIGSSRVLCKFLFLVMSRKRNLPLNVEKNNFALKRHIFGLAEPFSYYYPRHKEVYSLNRVESLVITIKS